MKLFRTFARGFCKKSKYSESPSQYSKILEKKFAGKYVTGQTNEILVRGEGLDGGVNFKNASQKYFDYIQDVQDDTIILPFGVADVECYQPEREVYERNGFGMSMWNSSAVSGRMNKQLFALQAGSSIPHGLAINNDELDQYTTLGHRHLVNVESMPLRTYLEKMKEFEKSDWDYIVRINNKPSKVGRMVENCLKEAGIDKNSQYDENDPALMIQIFEKSWEPLMAAYAKAKAEDDLKDYMLNVGFMAYSCGLTLNTASGAMALMWTLVHIGHDAPQLLKATFEKNKNLFDKKFEEKFDNFLEKSKEKLGSASLTKAVGKGKTDGLGKKYYSLIAYLMLFVVEDDEIKKLALYLLNKLGDLAHFEFILPSQCPNDIVSILKNIEYFSYKLPVLLNKQWLTYCLGYRCLEMIFRDEENEIAYDKRIISSLSSSSVELSRDLDNLHDKFVSIDNMVITPRMNKNEKRNEDGEYFNGPILQEIEMKATTLREEIENDTFLSEEQKKKHSKIILEAQSLLQMHYMIESVNDTFDINFENIFTLRDISLLESGYYEAFEQCHRNLQLMELESDPSDEACSKRNVGPHGWLMVKFERILKALYGND